MTLKITEKTWRRVVQDSSGHHCLKCSTLDHIYVNQEDSGSYGLLESCGSDHEMISFSIKGSRKAKLIPTLKIKRRDLMCVGMDGVPSKALKLVAPFFINEIVELFNLIPDLWRIAVVRPLHKSGSQKACKNYRLISNLCSMAKLYDTFSFPDDKHDFLTNQSS
jgi:hypothetical protein